MTDGEIDDLLKRAGEASKPLDLALLDRVARSIEPTLAPVRPIAPRAALAGALALTGAAVALAGALRLGLFGIHKMDAWDRGLIFPLLAALVWLAASTSAAEVIPGSRRPASPRWLLWAGTAALTGLFALLFRDYHTDAFLRQGIACLTAGMLHALVTGLAAWWLLRRGYAVDAAGAGWAAGMLAGLAGVSMLELHCPNLEAPHVMVWHTAVLVLSAALGAALARRGKRPAGRP